MCQFNAKSENALVRSAFLGCINNLNEKSTKPIDNPTQDSPSMSESKLVETCQSYLNKLEAAIINEYDVETLSILNSLQVASLFTLLLAESSSYLVGDQEDKSCRFFETALACCEQYNDQRPDKKGNSPLEKLHPVKIQGRCHQTSSSQTFRVFRIQQDSVHRQGA